MGLKKYIYQIVHQDLTQDLKLTFNWYLCYSALYVVDLVKFRKIAAGDRLRGQYQALSQDPNSLANLDQVSIFVHSIT